MNRFFAVLTTISLVATASCHSIQTAGPEPEPATPADRTEPISPTKTLWILKPATGNSITYEFKQQASITSYPPAVTTQQLPLQLAEFTLISESTRHSSEITITRITPPNQEEVPLLITVHSSGGYIYPELSGRQKQMENTCNQTDAGVIPGISASVLTLPLTLTVGMIWSDSISSTACTGSIPTKSKTIRTYHVRGEAASGERPGITIDTEERTITSGEGSDDQHRVTISSSGTGRGHLTVSAVDGSLLLAAVETKSSIQISSSGRSQQFEQLVTRSIARTK